VGDEVYLRPSTIISHLQYLCCTLGRGKSLSTLLYTITKFLRGPKQHRGKYMELEGYNIHRDGMGWVGGFLFFFIVVF
jgi:hypothetical protein